MQNHHLFDVVLTDCTSQVRLINKETSNITQLLWKTRITQCPKWLKDIKEQTWYTYIDKEDTVRYSPSCCRYLGTNGNIGTGISFLCKMIHFTQYISSNSLWTICLHQYVINSRSRLSVKVTTYERSISSV